MPKLSDTMEEGTILEWKKKDGDEVHKGDVLAEVESDKATFDLEAEEDGVLSIKVEKGVPAKIGAPIATIGPAGAAPATAAKTDGKSDGAAGETKPAEEKAATARSKPEPATAEPAAEEDATTAEGPEAEAPVSDVLPAEAEPEELPSPPPPRAKEPAAARSSDGATDGVAIKASPIAKRLAAELGVNLAGVKGSGPDGRIVKEDVEALAKGKGGATRPPAGPPSRRAEGPDTEMVEPTRMQATIARRMTESKTTVPEFTVTVEARVDQAVSMRQQLKDSVPGADKVTMTDFLVRACALALRKFPEVNSSWIDGRFQRKRSINIGLAVAPSQGMGLLVPVVHNADTKDIVQISIESRQVIERARSGRPAEGDLSGATFSISNLGMYGVDEFVAIINPPEAAILAVGTIKDAAVVEDERVVVGKVMRMTLSVDHRVFYGATAAQFMAEIKRLLENPVTLVVPPAQ
jgi:pyruvate dehydrogenase E2 component (dihydrolipoamide acetyltransferase)